MYAWIIVMTVEVVLSAEPVAASTAHEWLQFKVNCRNVHLQVMLTLGG